MNEFLNGILSNEVFVNFITAIITAILGLVSAYIIMMLKKLKIRAELEIGKLESDKGKALLNEALWRVEILAEKTVTALEQTAAKELRELVKDGKADKKELSELSHKAFAEITAQLSPEYETALERGVGDAHSYIMNCIEAQVFQLKQRV